MIGHCSWWQLAGLIIALIGAAAILGAAFVALLPTAITVTKVSLVKAIITGLGSKALKLGAAAALLLGIIMNIVS